MKKKLYMHIGASKCASSSIQRNLYENSDLLRRFGHSLSGKDLTWNGSVSSRTSATYLADIKKLGEKNAKKVIAEKLNNARKSSIISSEYLWSSDGFSLFKGMLDDFDVSVLFVVRRQDMWIYSAWKQWWVKKGYSLDEFVDECMAVGRPDFGDAMQRWSDLVGENNVTLISLDFLEEPLHRVLSSWIGVDLPPTSNESSNDAFDFRLLDLMSRHPSIHSDVHDRRIEKIILKTKSAYQKRYALPEADSLRILERFQKDNERLLGQQKADRLAPASDRLPTMTGKDDLEFVVACLMEAVGALNEELVQARRSIAQLRKQVLLPDRKSHELGIENESSMVAAMQRD